MRDKLFTQLVPERHPAEKELVEQLGPILGQAVRAGLADLMALGDYDLPNLRWLKVKFGINRQRGEKILPTIQNAYQKILKHFGKNFQDFEETSEKVESFSEKVESFDASNPRGYIKEEENRIERIEEREKEKTTKKEKTDIASVEACEFPLSEKALSNEKTKEPLHFERFWHKLDAIASTVIDAYKSQIISEGWRGDQYTPHVITWLNGRCWENQPVQPAPFKRPAAFDDPEYEPPSYARMTTEYLKSDFPSIEAYIRWRHRQGKNFNPAVKAVYNPEEDSNLMRAG
jgi:hypothetical protein